MTFCVVNNNIIGFSRTLSRLLCTRLQTACLMSNSERYDENLLKSFRVLDNDNTDDDDHDGGRKNSRSLSQYSQYTDPDAPLEYASLNESSTFSCYINLLNTIIGSGVLGLPYAVGYCGVVLGVILILVFGAINIFSCHLLTVVCWESSTTCILLFSDRKEYTPIDLYD
jgi:hypothetical protein